MPTSWASRVAGLLLLGAALASIDARRRWFTLDVDAPSVVDPAQRTSPVTDPVAEEVAKVAELFRDRAVVFIDASLPKDFAEEGRIPGARSLPPEAFEGGAVPADLDLISRDAAIVVYCRSEHCDAAEFVIARLRELGYGGARLFRNGFRAWKAAGHPVERGP